jgi:type VI secretion system protein ImpF
MGSGSQQESLTSSQRGRAAVPRSDYQPRLTPSLLDRLLDSKCRESQDAAHSSAPVLPRGERPAEGDQDGQWCVLDFQGVDSGASPRPDTLKGLKWAVRRDLDALLNSRNTFYDLSSEFVEAERSVLTFGLPDFLSFSYASARDQARLRQAVEDAIRRFEPRLTGLSVTIAETAPHHRSLRLHIEAQLLADPARDRVGFDVVLAEQSRKCEVRNSE